MKESNQVNKTDRRDYIIGEAPGGMSVKYKLMLLSDISTEDKISNGDRIIVIDPEEDYEKTTEEQMQKILNS